MSNVVRILPILLAVAAAELIFRFGPLKVVPLRGPAARAGGCAVYYGEPGMPQEFENQVCRNSSGLHDVEHSISARAGVRRVLIVGDSFVDSSQVPLERTFFRRLEADWNFTHAREPIEVIAVGLPNSGQTQQLPLLESALRSNPKIVFSFFYCNDPQNNEGSINLPSRQAPAWLRWSRVAALLQRRLQPPLTARQTSGYSEAQWRLSEAALAQMQRLAGKRGAEFVVVSVPYRHSTTGECLKHLRLMPYPLMDISPDLAEHERRYGTQTTFQHDIHWNDAGHAAVASALRRRLEKSFRIAVRGRDGG